MRIAFIVSFASNVILALVSLIVLPERVAIHFGPGGIPNNWVPNYVNSLIFLGLNIVLFVCIYFSPHLTFIFPPKLINLPNKQFWLATENRHQTVAKISALIYQFGVAIFLFLFVIGLLTIQANLTKPVRLKERYFFFFLIPFMAYSIAWCIVFFKSFRIPNKNNLAMGRCSAPLGAGIMKHRIVFTGVWIVFAVALVIFPGFEARGFAAGMIIGGWPALISARIWESQYHHPFILLLMMLILSGTTVGLLAWLLDKAKIPKAIWIALGFFIVFGIAVLNYKGLNYERWQGTPSVSQAIESANYQPSRWDFNREIVLPRSLAGGLWGLYGIVGVCALCSVVILLKGRTRKTTPNKPDSGDALQRA